MRRALIAAVATLCGLALSVSSTGTAAADATSMVSPPELGFSFTPDGNAGQCDGPTQQWAPSPDWTADVLIDADSRSGGCVLAFGIRDLDGVLTGLSVTYRWQVSWGGVAGQCGNQGEFSVPVTTSLVVGPSIKVDTDDRRGHCDLTFALSGRSDVALDVEYWHQFGQQDPGAGQCRNSLPQGQWHSVRPGSPVTIGVDTDSRRGGCYLSLRLRQF